VSGAENKKQRDVLRDTFRCGIALKGLHALVECVTGSALLFVPGQMLNQFVLFVGRIDLSLDRNDVIETHLQNMAAGLVGTGRHFAAAYLLSHGLVKLVLVIELLRNRLWAYPLMIVMLAAFIGYQSYRFLLTHSIAMVILTVFDAVVIALTWLEYREQLRLRQEEVR
jgi:uncharacterized membrane protein